jgi:YD repeat-containing protein
LRESILVAGTPFELNYRSDRVPGRTRPLPIQISGPTILPGTERFDLQVEVAGRSIQQSFPALPNQQLSFVWDHLDAFGRAVPGAQPATVRVGPVVHLRYQLPPTRPATWGWMSAFELTQNPSRAEATLWTVRKTTLGGWDQRGVGLGGWSLSPHHVYDPSAQIVYYGDGERRTTGGLPATIRAFAGTGSGADTGDGGPALAAQLRAPSGLGIGADGSVFVADRDSNRVRRVAPDGTIGSLGSAASQPNLIQNPSAEEPTVAAGQIPGWSAFSGGDWHAVRPALPTDTPSFDGEYFFYPGATSSAELRQEVDVSSFATSIDAGSQGFAFQGFVRSFNQSPPDRGRIILEYLNQAKSAVLVSFDSGQIGNTGAWQRVANQQTAPIGTRFVRVRLLATRQLGSSNDAYFDGMSLRAVAPAPNLVQNGNAEAAIVTAGTVPGWTSVVGTSWGVYTRAICADCPTAYDGQQYFFAGAAASAELAQEVDVTSYAAAIDAGTQSFAFNANVAAYNQVPTDGSRVIVEYRNGAGTILSAFDSAEIQSINLWIPISDVRRAPVGTRRIRIRLLSIRHNGTANDGYFDGVALRPVSSEFTDGTMVALNGPAGLAVGADGSVYVADRNNHRVVRFRPNGSAVVIAGTGDAGSSGDNGPGTLARLSSPTGGALGADGSIYIADYGNQKVRRVAVDGTIGTVAGTGSLGYSGDGGPATQATLFDPVAVTVARDGSVYIADRSNHVVRRIAANGRIQTVAGNGAPGFGGDGGPATQAQLNRPASVALGSDGSLFIADDFNHRIRQVRDGTIQTVAGSAAEGNAGDGGQALSAQLRVTSAVAISPDQGLLIADSVNHRIRKVTGTLPGLGATDLVIPRPSANQVDIFDARGKHLRTLNSLTAAVVQDFGYDSAGRLETLTDFDGNVTRIERDTSGAPTAIVAPFGQRTAIALDSDGYLSTVSDPLGNQVVLGYGVDGLLTSEQDARGNLHSFEYETDGRLKKDSDPAGGFKTLAP